MNLKKKMPKPEDIKTLITNMEINLKSEFRNLLKHELNTYLVKFEEKLDKIMTDLNIRKKKFWKCKLAKLLLIMNWKKLKVR